MQKSTVNILDNYKHDFRYIWGNITECIVIARYAPPRVPCSCHRPCCSGWTPNIEWRRAVRVLSQVVSQTCFNSTGDVIYQFEVTAQYFLREQERTPLDRIASEIHIHKTTAYRHFRAVKEYFRGTKTSEGVEQIAFNLIDETLRGIGLVGDID